MAFDPHGYVKLPNSRLDMLVDVMETFEHGLFQFDPEDEYINSEHFEFLFENNYVYFSESLSHLPNMQDRLCPRLTEEGEEFLAILKSHQDL